VSIPSRMQDSKLVLSKLKQTNFATALTDANLIAGKRIMVDSPVYGQTDITRWTDKGLSQKGHDYATRAQTSMYALSETLKFPLESWLAAWSFAFGLGKVASTQPNAGGNPTAWQHVIKPLDPGTDGKDLPVTTIYAEVNQATAMQRRLVALCANSVSLEFPANAPGQLTVGLTGSGAIVTGVLATPPAIPLYNLLMSNDMVFKYGTQGAPVDISSEIVSGSVKFSFTWNLDDANSRAPGGGVNRSRAWVTSPSISLDFQRFVDDASATVETERLSDSAKEVKVTVAGSQIGTGPERHQIEIRGLAVVPAAVKIGQSGDKSVYQYSLPAECWHKEGAADVVTVTVQNLETSFLV
jgi:hypothetical protein